MSEIQCLKSIMVSCMMTLSDRLEALQVLKSITMSDVDLSNYSTVVFNRKDCYMVLSTICWRYLSFLLL